MKMTVGPVLAKAVAETVVAQPSNPQEFLALYLLHHLQEEERRVEHAAEKEKAELLREEWERTHTRDEKLAVDCIQQAFRKHQVRLRNKKQREAELLEAYEEAEGEAQDLLDQVEEDTGAAGSAAGGDGAGGEGEDEEAAGGARGEVTMEDLEEAMSEARTNFYTSQRFMLRLSKSDFGELKAMMLERKERIRIHLQRVRTLVDTVTLEEEHIEDIEFDPEHRQPNFSPAAALLADKIHGKRDHSRIGIPYMTYGVLRAACYFLFNSTPRQVDSPAKVAALLKPTVAVQLLRAFDPCGTYDKNKPLDLERRLPKDEGAEEEKEENEEELENIPVPQPKGRQVRRVHRLFRALMLDHEYIPEVDPAKFFEEDAADEHEEVQAELDTFEANQERASQIRQSVEEQTKSLGGVVLWALMVFLRNAAAYRVARDEWVKGRRDRNLDVPDSYEMPDEEEEDDQNEEVLVDDDGEPDFQAMHRMMEKIGTDADEQLAKLWEAKNARLKRDFASKSEALRKLADAEENEEAEDEDDEA